MKTFIKIVLVGLIMINCVQETHIKTITFKVDMNGIEDVFEVGIRGNFTTSQWTETIPLTDKNNDGIYEGTFSQKTAVSQIQFKFVNQDGDYELKGKDNRIIEFEYKPETIIYKAVFSNSKKIEIIKK